MTVDGLSQIIEDMAFLHATSLRNRQQTTNRPFPLRAAIAETGFAPLHGWPLGPFHTVIGRLDPLIPRM